MLGNTTVESILAPFETIKKRLIDLAQAKRHAITVRAQSISRLSAQQTADLSEAKRAQDVAARIEALLTR